MFCANNKSCQVPEYCGAHVTEKSVVKNGFELIFAFDEVVALGYRENVSNVEQIRTFTNMDSQEEISYERQQKVLVQAL